LLAALGGTLSPHWLTVLIVACAAAALALIIYSLVVSGKRGWGWICAGAFIVVILAFVSVIIGMFRLFGDTAGARRSAGHYTGDHSWNMGRWGPGRTGSGGSAGRW